MKLFIAVIFLLSSTTIFSYADENSKKQITDISKPVASETAGLNAYVIGLVSGFRDNFRDNFRTMENYGKLGRWKIGKLGTHPLLFDKRAAII
ncbi:MAG: hypothetical protein WA104_02000 [Thermodesulfovibrionales bacterium]